MNGNGTGNPENLTYGQPYQVGLDREYVECEQYFADADKAISDGDITGAVELLVKIIQRNPNFGKAYNHLGWIYETKYKQFTKAEENYKLAIHYSPEYAAPYLNYAYFLSTMQRFDELKAHLDRSMMVPSVSKETLYNEYATMYELQGEPQTAADYYMKAAMNCFDDAKFEKYQQSIERCKKKLQLKNSMETFPQTPLNF